MKPSSKKKQRDERNEHLEAILKRLREMSLSNASHEIRTSLSIIKMSIESLETNRAGSGGADEKEVLEILKRNSNKLTKLIDNLLGKISQLP